jgi:hypothetical protein
VPDRERRESGGQAHFEQPSPRRVVPHTAEAHDEVGRAALGHRLEHRVVSHHGNPVDGASRTGGVGIEQAEDLGDPALEEAIQEDAGMATAPEEDDPGPCAHRMPRARSWNRFTIRR